MKKICQVCVTNFYFLLTICRPYGIIYPVFCQRKVFIMLRAEKNILRGKPLLWALTLVYFSTYMTRVNLAAIIQEVVTDTGFEKSTLSVILICLSTAYGLGQIINGRLGDKFKPQNVMFVGCTLSTAINLIFPFFSNSVFVMAALWGINGFAQAMMWPPIVRIMVANFDDEEYGSAQIFISWGTSLATILVYLIAPILIAIGSWKLVLWTCGAVGVAGCILWATQKNRVSLTTEDSALSQISTDEPKKSEKMHFPAFAVFPIILIGLGVMFQGMLRDGVTAWMPSYLAEVFTFGNGFAIFCTVILAIFSGIAFSVVGAIYKKWFKNEVFCACFIFMTAALCSLVLFFFFEGGGAILAIAMMAMITGCMHGVNLMLVSHVPKRFKKYGNISTVSGTINACSHVGAAIFTYGIALLSEKIGWQYTVGVWFLIAILGAIVCIIASKHWKKMLEE